MASQRHPIRQKVQRIVLLLCVAALLLTSATGIFCILKIRSDVTSGNQKLGADASSSSQDALLAQMEQNLLDLAGSKAAFADAKFSKYADYVRQFSAYIDVLYQSPADYVPRMVLPPDAANRDALSMQRYLADDRIDLEAVRGEIALLGNLASVWNPVIRADAQMITTIYIGTQSGFMLSYDARADLGDTGAAEEYYDYYDAGWYRSARDADGLIFTDTYPDAYGRGLTISCAAPFHDARGHFAGVVCMDILIADINREVIAVDLGEHAGAFLVDGGGQIIASPTLTDDQSEFENILTDAAHPAHPAAERIMSGETGLALTDAGVYYAYSPIEGTGWTLVIQNPEADVIAPAVAIGDDIAAYSRSAERSLNRNFFTAILIFIAAFALIIAAVILFTRRFARKLTEPLSTLRRDVGEISGGNLDYRAVIFDNDEIGDLAEAFNRMAGSLKQYVLDLTSVTAEKERIGAELDVARHIQSSMLPCIFPAFPDRPEIDIYATMNPAKEVGGDFYDFFMVDERHLAIVMADVSGKGVPAALFMVIGKTLIKDHTQPGHDLGSVFSEVNNMLCESNSEGLFITAFEGVLDLVTGEFNFVNAGHEMPFIRRAGGDFEPYKIRPGFVLAGMENMKYKAGSLVLNVGDKLFQYTDGVTEATDAENRLYGMDRLARVLNRNREGTPLEILPAVKADIDAFVGAVPQFDDITMLCLEFRAKMRIGNE